MPEKARKMHMAKRTIKYDPMPTPSRNGVRFEEFLVPARNNIQKHLLRVQKLIGYPKEDVGPKARARYELVGALIGAVFSLWRAVFQSLNPLRQENAGLEAGRDFLNKIIKDNAAQYTTELNPWSLGFYLNNARYRLVEMERRLRKKGIKVDSELKALIPRMKKLVRGFTKDAPEEWIDCFKAMTLIINAVEAHFDKPTSQRTRNKQR
jgi:hypothetical protein